MDGQVHQVHPPGAEQGAGSSFDWAEGSALARAKIRGPCAIFVGEARSEFVWGISFR